MVQVYTINGNKVPVKGHLGLEIEVESNNSLPTINNFHWTTKDEGSLRNFGLEYVTNGAVDSGKDYITIINQLTQELNKSIYLVIKDSDRTSVHVHKNVTEFTTTKVWVAITAYWLFENLLFKYCGPLREGNSFCLRLKDAEGLLSYAERDLETSKYDIPFSTFRRDEQIRYAGINLSAIPKFGSIEFRGMRGTIDTDEISCWSQSLNKLVDNATEFFASPEDLLNFYFKKGWLTLYELLIPKQMQYSLFSIKDKGGLIEENAYKLTSICFGPNWDLLEKSIKTRFEKQKLKKKKALPENFDQYQSYLSSLDVSPTYNGF